MPGGAPRAQDTELLRIILQGHSNGFYLPVSQPDDLGVDFKELEGNVKRMIFYAILQEYQSLLFNKEFEKS